jgi:hypothetical protein
LKLNKFIYSFPVLKIYLLDCDHLFLVSD